MSDNEKLMDVKLVKENGNYFLDLTYQHEDDKAIYETNIPRVYLPLSEHGFEYWSFDVGCHTNKEHAINLGFGELRLLKDKNGAVFTTAIVEEKTKEMTIEEIEKALGHKVKIVGEKEEYVVKKCSTCKYEHQYVGQYPCTDRCVRNHNSWAAKEE